MTTIWHNPRCSKSRATLALLEENGVTPEVRRYLDDAPSEAEIRAVLDALNAAPIELMRRGEQAFKTLGLSKDSDDATLIAAMGTHPILIERPIVIHKGRARIGRPPESVLEIL
ncbi:arsenate reductase (glutaredoxin) [Aliiroseovarius subalbicans]|uniref:arsenate reductase (glutaredoxin) n=1 Tax=Aliiroseovarius subalbicans TaxID=2925840 RepID=UPI001F568E9B|nr:arsenate reductase (glutaredoxin) [Aliiroseovarius subalbicans]MCI2399169.1 arsenate reductase (glutaredoxin) [Aliiroseovarius subalbicans]